MKSGSEAYDESEEVAANWGREAAWFVTCKVTEIVSLMQSCSWSPFEEQMIKGWYLDRQKKEKFYGSSKLININANSGFVHLLVVFFLINLNSQFKCKLLPFKTPSKRTKSPFYASDHHLIRRWEFKCCGQRLKRISFSGVDHVLSHELANRTLVGAFIVKNSVFFFSKHIISRSNPLTVTK